MFLGYLTAFKEWLGDACINSGRHTEHNYYYPLFPNEETEAQGLVTYQGHMFIKCPSPSLQVGLQLPWGALRWVPSAVYKSSTLPTTWGAGLKKAEVSATISNKLKCNHSLIFIMCPTYSP